MTEPSCGILFNNNAEPSHSMLKPIYKTCSWTPHEWHESLLQRSWDAWCGVRWDWGLRITKHSFSHSKKLCTDMTHGSAVASTTQKPRARAATVSGRGRGLTTVSASGDGAAAQRNLGTAVAVATTWASGRPGDDESQGSWRGDAGRDLDEIKIGVEIWYPLVIKHGYGEWTICNYIDSFHINNGI